jgi:hypothetical protein
VPEWVATLKDESLRGEKTLHNYKSVDDLAKAQIEARKLIGQGVTKIPGADAKPDEVRAFWDKLGVPKDVQGYADVKLEADKSLGPINAQAIDEIAKPGFLKLGLTPQQAQGALNLFRQYMTGEQRRLADTYVAGQGELRKAWGLNFDANVGLAQRAFDHYVPDTLRGAIAATQLDQHPEFLKLWHTIALQIAEDGLIDGTAPGALSADEVDTKIEAARKQLEGLERGSPDYKRAMDAYEALWQTKARLIAAAR